MDELLKAFRSEAEGVGSGAGRKFGKEAIARGGAFARARREQGAAWGVIAGELGVGVPTVVRWAGSEAATTTGFHRVTVVDGATRGSLAAVLPGGVRIEGLDLASVIELARALS